MAEFVLIAQPREVQGKKVARLRRAGLLPAVVYGPAVAGPSSIQLDRKEFETFYARSGASRLLTLKIGDDGPAQQVFIRDVQYNMLRRRVDHIDFYAARMDIETTTSVPILLIGEAPITKRGEGVVTLALPVISVRALPHAIPGSLPIDISGIETLDDDVRAGDLPLPEGVALIDAPDTIVISVTRATLEEEPTDEAAADTEGAASDESPAADDEAGGA